ncbi:MAG: ABC transporter substrate-binding protein [Paludibacteraceae bacterium]|nr:ABC transporter substrate-binding protein [Paludibacteraceae bacterium]
MRNLKRTAVILSGCLLVMSSWLLTACHPEEPCTVNHLCVRTVAVVLPFEDGLREQWEQCLNLCNANLQMAFCYAGKGVNLRFEWYNESTEDLSALSRKLAARKDIVAVIGGLYSSSAAQLASGLCKGGKPLFTLGTTEQLVREYSTSGNLWAMTETDITACEVMLSKAMQYGAKSVALLVNGATLYGQTYLDWFAFQAEELELENKGTYSYDGTEAQIAQQTKAALASGADYVLCASGSVDELRTVLRTMQDTPHTNQMLMAESGFSGDAINKLGPLMEGVEGVAYGANPESGFDVAYQARFNRLPCLGEAQVYDAAMLIAFASYLQMLNHDLTFKKAMRQLVDGREQGNGSWRGEDLAWLASRLADGAHPDISGASGSLDFDSKVYTNVLHTVYYNYFVYQQKYIFLDYNTTDGSRRTDPTLASWNWKKSQQQDITYGGEEHIYPPLDKRWALLVASSHGWSNYRHQVDVLNIYQILKRHGYDDDHIVVIIEDDLAYNRSNPQPGVLYTRMDGVNVYHDVQVDYHLSQLNPKDVLEILLGHASERLPQVLRADADDNIFFFWSGHGSPGEMCWDDTPHGITKDDLEKCLSQMEQSGNYRKLIGCIETCFSGGVAKAADDHNGMLFFTAANANETSKADEYNYNWDVWMSNRFTATLQDCMINTPSQSFAYLYNRLFQSTVGSHVCVFGHKGFGSLYESNLSEILE